VTYQGKAIIADFSENSQGKLMADESWSELRSVEDIAMSEDGKLHLVGVGSGNSRSLLTVDLDSGEKKLTKLGTTSEVFPQTVSAQALARSPKMLPLMKRTVQQQGNIRRSVFVFTFVERKTGKELDKVDLPGMDKNNHSVAYFPPVIRNNMIIATLANQEVRAYKAK
jgi:hypothetical protein